MSTYTWKPVALHLCLLLQQQGFTLDIADNGEEEVAFDNDLDTFVDCLVACDEAVLCISRPFENGGMKKMRILLVFGNEPHETVANYSVDEKLEAALELFEEFWSTRKKPLFEAEASWVEEVRGVFNALDAAEGTPPAERPTPITDKIFAGWVKDHPAKLSHATLERQLAEAREQRDRLAEALRNIKVGLENEQSHGLWDAEYIVASIIDPALATLKGGKQ